MEVSRSPLEVRLGRAARVSRRHPAGPPCAAGGAAGCGRAGGPPRPLACAPPGRRAGGRLSLPPLPRPSPPPPACPTLWPTTPARPCPTPARHLRPPGSLSPRAPSTDRRACFARASLARSHQRPPPSPPRPRVSRPSPPLPPPLPISSPSTLSPQPSVSHAAVGARVAGGRNVQRGAAASAALALSRARAAAATAAACLCGCRRGGGGQTGLRSAAGVERGKRWPLACVPPPRPQRRLRWRRLVRWSGDVSVAPTRAPLPISTGPLSSPTLLSTARPPVSRLPPPHASSSDRPTSSSLLPPPTALPPLLLLVLPRPPYLLFPRSPLNHFATSFSHHHPAPCWGALPSGSPPPPSPAPPRPATAAAGRQRWPPLWGSAPPPWRTRPAPCYRRCWRPPPLALRWGWRRSVPLPFRRRHPRCRLPGG